MSLPRFNALEAMRDIEREDGGKPTLTLATLETLAATPYYVPSPLRDRILSFNDDEWCEIEERAAIIQHDGAMRCFEAEARAIAEQLARKSPAPC